jgi:hypothetical protein
MTVLSKDEKLQIIASHKRGLEYKKYVLKIDQIVENAKSDPNPEAISNLSVAMEDLDNQVAALDSEAALVEQLSE